jgi:hypothetical protein
MILNHHLTAILIFATIFFSGFSGKAQNDIDTIRIEKKGVCYLYYQNGKVLNFKQLSSLTRENKEAYQFMTKAKDQNIAAFAFAFVGGGCLGYSLGYALVSVMDGNPLNKSLFYSLLGVGVGLTGIGIVFDISAKKTIKKGIDAYNNSTKQKNNTNLNLGFSPNRMSIRLNFYPPLTINPLTL